MPPITEFDKYKKNEIKWSIKKKEKGKKTKQFINASQGNKIIKDVEAYRDLAGAKITRGAKLN